MPPKAKRPTFIIYPARPSKTIESKLHKYLDNIYFNTASAAAYSSPSILLAEVKRRNYYRNIGIKRIQRYLARQNAYTLYRPIIERFPVPRVMVRASHVQMEMDLMDVSRDSKENDNVRFFLTAMDSFSKMGFVEQLLNKEAKHVALAAARILDRYSTECVSTDRGAEYKAKAFLQLLEHRGIRHFFAGGSGKNTILERWHKTLRAKIARLQQNTHNMRYIDDMQKLVTGYNASYHSSIKMRPKDVNATNEHVVYSNLYNWSVPELQRMRNPSKYMFPLGDTVRISAAKHVFRKEHFQRWSTEVFTISKRFRMQGHNMYTLMGCDHQPLEQNFYQQELKSVTVDPDALFKIEKILKEKTENGVKKVLVKWEGVPRACAQWIIENTLQPA